MFLPKVWKKEVFFRLECAFVCFINQGETSLDLKYACVCMDRLYLQWPITHLFSIGEIGWTGNKSHNLLILPGVFISVYKNYYFCFYGIYSAHNYSVPRALVFTMWGVKERKKEWHTNTAPTLSVSFDQPHFLVSKDECDPATLHPLWEAHDTTCWRYSISVFLLTRWEYIIVLFFIFVMLLLSHSKVKGSLTPEMWKPRLR